MNYDTGGPATAASNRNVGEDAGIDAAIPTRSGNDGIAAASNSNSPSCPKCSWSRIEPRLGWHRFGLSVVVWFFVNLLLAISLPKRPSELSLATLDSLELHLVAGAVNIGS